MSSQPRKKRLLNISKNHILNTTPKAGIKKIDISVGILSYRSAKLCDIKNRTVYITTWVLKHIYDRHFEIYDIVVKNLYLIISSPDTIYWNKKHRRGQYLFYKSINNVSILLVLEEMKKKCFIVTVFNTNERYLSKLEIVNQEGQRTPHRTVK
ncbi:MAG: hypothetical protein WCR68_01235, partial [Candidatus Dojkabacteria bacterium]|jgi:hypothetical protein|nr:PBECR2 nuclease fold domain-containing protein [Candidatus Dojkabacteria bacterium]